MEAQGFRRFVPHLDRPDVLSLFTCTIEAPVAEFNELLSNGNRAGGGPGAVPAEFVVGGVEPTTSGTDRELCVWYLACDAPDLQAIFVFVHDSDPLLP
jgi:hypothetical protein